MESGIWNLESGIWNLESGIWNLESGLTPNKNVCARTQADAGARAEPPRINRHHRIESCLFLIRLSFDLIESVREFRPGQYFVEGRQKFAAGSSAPASGSSDQCQDQVSLRDTPNIISDSVAVDGWQAEDGAQPQIQNAGLRRHPHQSQVGNLSFRLLRGCRVLRENYWSLAAPLCFLF